MCYKCAAGVAEVWHIFVAGDAAAVWNRFANVAVRSMLILTGVVENASRAAPEAAKQDVHGKKRIAIAAEALSSASDVKIPHIPKTDSVLNLLGVHHWLNPAVVSVRRETTPLA